MVKEFTASTAVRKHALEHTFFFLLNPFSKMDRKGLFASEGSRETSDLHRSGLCELTDPSPYKQLEYLLRVWGGGA